MMNPALGAMTRRDFNLVSVTVAFSAAVVSTSVVPACTGENARWNPYRDKSLGDTGTLPPSMTDSASDTVAQDTAVDTGLTRDVFAIYEAEHDNEYPAGVSSNGGQTVLTATPRYNGNDVTNGLRFIDSTGQVVSVSFSNLGGYNLNSGALLATGAAVAVGNNGVTPRLFVLDSASENATELNLASYGNMATGVLTDGAAIYATASTFNTRTGVSTGGKLVVSSWNSGSNAIVTDSAVDMEGSNPTAMGKLNDSKIVVLSSGDAGNRTAYLNIYDPVTKTVRNVKIQAGSDIIAQINDRLSFSEDEKYAYIGTADETGRVLKVDLSTGEVVATANTGASSSHSQVTRIGDTLYVVDFNNERVYAYNANSLALYGYANLGVEAGPAIADNDLLKLAGNKSLWSIAAA